MQTTLGKLETSVAPHNLYISPVKYRHYHEGPTFDDELDPFMHKRKGFHCENEVRLLKVNDAHCIALFNGAPAVAEPGEHLPLDWSAADVIEQIVLSPYAEEDFEERALAAIGGPVAARPCDSVCFEPAPVCTGLLIWCAWRPIAAELTRLATAHLTAHPEIIVRATKAVRNDPALRRMAERHGGLQ